MALINMMEKFVQQKLDEMLESTDCCDCEDCKNDIMAVALNQLPAKYVNTAAGELFSKLDSITQQNSVDIDIALLKAINIVCRNPRHTVNQTEK
ncbi:MAG: late competence development ComFB family protein [Clostridiales bacterium]|nr:late competence development ComFB family protein [Clostridiales bacterium]